MKIAISLGNSHLGRHAVDVLIEKGVPAGDIVAIARSPEKLSDLAERGVEVRFGDYGDRPSLEKALDGVDRLYMISGMAPPPERIPQHEDVIEAAKAANVKAIVYTSFIDNNEDSPFFAWTINKDTEARLKDSGMAYTILRHGMYSEADLDYIGEYKKNGEVANNIGEGKISYISRRDLVLAAVHCLLDGGHQNKTYELTGPEAITQADLAAWISKWTGKPIPYRQISDEEYKKTFPDPHWAEVVVTLYQAVRLGNMERITADFEEIVGRPAETIAESFARYYEGRS